MREEVVIHEVVYPYPPERVWEALTSSDALSDWLMPNNFQPRVGHRFTFLARTRYGSSEAIECQVVEAEKPYRLVYTWRSDPSLPTTLVTWELEPAGNGTRLRLTHQRQAQVGEIHMSRFFRLQVDEVALTDELFAFVTDPSPTRTNRPGVNELHNIVPDSTEVLESMVLDGVETREPIAEYVHAVISQMLA